MVAVVIITFLIVYALVFFNLGVLIANRQFIKKLKELEKQINKVKGDE